MEITGQQIFKRLSGQVANVGSVLGNVKHGIEDMKKEAEKASQQQQMKERALESAQNEIDSKKDQNVGWQDRQAAVSAPQAEMQAQPEPQPEMEGGKK